MPENKPFTPEANRMEKERTENRDQPSGMTSAPAEGRPNESRDGGQGDENRPVERPRSEGGRRARGTAAMDPGTRQEVARKGGLAVSRNRQHMAEIGRKGGQTVSKNRDHMAQIGRKGGEASRGRS